MGTTAATVIIANALFFQAGQHPAPLFATKPNVVTAPVVEPIPAPRPRVIEMTPPTPAPAPAVARTRADVITDIQRDLARKGFYDGAVDGIWGARTDTSLRDFIQASGLKIQSEATEDVVRTLQRSAVSKGMRPIAELAPVPAATHNDPIAEMLTPPREIPAPQSSPPLPAGSKRLVAVQRALADFGYGQVKATGTMGPDTQAAIERFERDRKLPVTGQLSDRLVRELASVTARPLD
jgi:peptidoglycan hydrolase-like protein with peptidoglycan-binding domain